MNAASSLRMTSGRRTLGSGGWLGYLVMMVMLGLGFGNIPMVPALLLLVQFLRFQQIKLPSWQKCSLMQPRRA